MYAQLKMVRSHKLPGHFFVRDRHGLNGDVRRRSSSFGFSPTSPPATRWTPALFCPTGFLLRLFVLAILILRQIAGWEETQ